jgi:hypothetical protein
MRSLQNWVIGAAVLLVAGGILSAAAGSTVLKAIGFAVGGLGAVLLTAFAFYAVGRSEDRAREAERRDRL